MKLFVGVCRINPGILYKMLQNEKSHRVMHGRKKTLSIVFWYMHDQARYTKDHQRYTTYLTWLACQQQRCYHCIYIINWLHLYLTLLTNINNQIFFLIKKKQLIKICDSGTILDTFMDISVLLYFLFHRVDDLVHITGSFKIEDVDDVLVRCFDITRIREEWMKQCPFLAINDECIRKFLLFDI